ncbi:MAG: class II glutamine amidotransferase, partial [Prevotella sp.]
MCELLGINSRKKIEVNRWLRKFYSHSEKHCHGWGMAQFYGSSVQLEKEPLQANTSQYLRSRIKHPI